LHHASGLVRLVDDDFARDETQRAARLGTVTHSRSRHIEIDEAHVDGLLVVDPHVLEKADVRAVLCTLAPRLAEDEADRGCQNRGGHHHEDDVDGVHPPWQDGFVGLHGAALCGGFGHDS